MNEQHTVVTDFSNLSRGNNALTSLFWSTAMRPFTWSFNSSDIFLTATRIVTTRSSAHEKKEAREAKVVPGSSLAWAWAWVRVLLFTLLGVTVGECCWGLSLADVEALGVLRGDEVRGEDDESSEPSFSSGRFDEPRGRLHVRGGST